MRRAPAAIVLILVLLGCIWAVNVFHYADRDEEMPVWLMATWLVLWAVLIVVAGWVIARVFRARRRARID